MSNESIASHLSVSLLDTFRGYLVRNATAFATAIAVCSALIVSGQTQNAEHLIVVDRERVAFPDVELLPQSSEPLLTRKGDWFFSISHEPDLLVLNAEAGDKLVTQSIRPNAVHKRFVFDLKRERFEPMRQEIRIELTDESVLQQIKKLAGVSGIKEYRNLGFSIVKIDVGVNPVEVLRTLKEDFEDDDARILTGFFDNEPM